MTPSFLALLLSSVACAILLGFLVADLRRLLVQHHADMVARREDEARRMEREQRLDARRAERREAKAQAAERERAADEVVRRRKAAADAQTRQRAAEARAARRRERTELEAERHQRLESILLVMVAHLRALAPVADAPELPDEERHRETVEIDVAPPPGPARAPGLAILPPPPPLAVTPPDDAALRAAGLQKRSGVAESTRPPPHKPPVRIDPKRKDTLPSAVAVAVAPTAEERPSAEELTQVSDRGMDLRLQAAQAGPLVPMRFEPRRGPGEAA